MSLISFMGKAYLIQNCKRDIRWVLQWVPPRAGTSDRVKHLVLGIQGTEGGQRLQTRSPPDVVSPNGGLYVFTQLIPLGDLGKRLGKFGLENVPFVLHRNIWRMDHHAS